MASWQRYAEGEKNYRSSDFRGSFSSGVAYQGDVRRHKYDCELAKAAAEYSRGPSYSDSTVASYRSAISAGDNVHYYGSSNANDRDRVAVGKLLQANHYGGRAHLTAHEAAHIREGAEWLAAHKHEFSRGFIESNKAIYSNAYGPDGKKVVDLRAFRM